MADEFCSRGRPAVPCRLGRLGYFVWGGYRREIFRHLAPDRLFLSAVLHQDAAHHGRARVLGDFTDPHNPGSALKLEAGQRVLVDQHDRTRKHDGFLRGL